MEDPDFPVELRRFIQAAIPEPEAAELLVLLHKQPDKAWNAEQLTDALRPSVVAPAQVQRHLDAFHARGVLALDEQGYRYAPQDNNAALVEQLVKVYNERPVTLIRMIYALKDTRIQSFADAFKFRKE